MKRKRQRSCEKITKQSNRMFSNISRLAFPVFLSQKMLLLKSFLHTFFLFHALFCINLYFTLHTHTLTQLPFQKILSHFSIVVLLLPHISFSLQFFFHFASCLFSIFRLYFSREFSIFSSNFPIIIKLRKFGDEFKKKVIIFLDFPK